jgi:Metallo-beta-lactamase superfamily
MPEPRIHASEVLVHRYVASAMPVNAYLVETPGGVVVVDSTLTVSDAPALRERAEDLNKPLREVLITHAHPDHYGGSVELVDSDEIPIVAATRVAAVIRRDDEIKEQIIRPMFGDEWPRVSHRTTASGWWARTGWSPSRATPLTSRCTASSPTGTGSPGSRTSAACGRSSPPAPSCTSGTATRRRPTRSPGRRATSTRSSRPSKRPTGRIRMRQKEHVVGRMTAYLPARELQFLMELSIEPVAAKLGLVAP